MSTFIKDTVLRKNLYLKALWTSPFLLTQTNKQTGFSPVLHYQRWKEEEVENRRGKKKKSQLRGCRKCPGDVQERAAGAECFLLPWKQCKVFSWWPVNRVSLFRRPSTIRTWERVGGGGWEVGGVGICLRLLTKCQKSWVVSLVKKSPPLMIWLTRSTGSIWMLRTKITVLFFGFSSKVRQHFNQVARCHDVSLRRG